MSGEEMPVVVHEAGPQIFIDLTVPLLLQLVSRPLLRSESAVLRAVGVAVLLQSLSTLLFAAGLDLAAALGRPVILTRRPGGP